MRSACQFDALGPAAATIVRPVCWIRLVDRGWLGPVNAAVRGLALVQPSRTTGVGVVPLSIMFGLLPNMKRVSLVGE